MRTPAGQWFGNKKSDGTHPRPPTRICLAGHRSGMSSWGIAMPDPTGGVLCAARGARAGTGPAADHAGPSEIDVDRDGRTDHWRLDIRRGAVAVSRSDDAADCVIAATATLFDDLASGHAQRDGRGPPRRARRSRATPASSSGSSACSRRRRVGRCRRRRGPSASGGADRWPANGSDPRRQHVRRLRRPRRHRVLADRADRPVLVRHALPVEVGPDDQRRAAQLAVDRRPPVLRVALLPRPGDRHDLHRRQAVGHPPARGRRTASTRS